MAAPPRGTLVLACILVIAVSAHVQDGNRGNIQPIHAVHHHVNAPKDVHTREPKVQSEPGLNTLPDLPRVKLPAVGIELPPIPAVSVESGSSDVDLPRFRRTGENDTLMTLPRLKDFDLGLLGVNETNVSDFSTPVSENTMPRFREMRHFTSSREELPLRGDSKLLAPESKTPSKDTANQTDAKSTETERLNLDSVLSRFHELGRASIDQVQAEKEAAIERMERRASEMQKLQDALTSAETAVRSIHNRVQGYVDQIREKEETRVGKIEKKENNIKTILTQMQERQSADEAGARQAQDMVKKITAARHLEAAQARVREYERHADQMQQQLERNRKFREDMESQMQSIARSLLESPSDSGPLQADVHHVPDVFQNFRDVQDVRRHVQNVHHVQRDARSRLEGREASNGMEGLGLVGVIPFSAEALIPQPLASSLEHGAGLILSGPGGELPLRVPATSGLKLPEATEAMGLGSEVGAGISNDRGVEMVSPASLGSASSEVIDQKYGENEMTKQVLMSVAPLV